LREGEEGKDDLKGKVEVGPACMRNGINISKTIDKDQIIGRIMLGRRSEIKVAELALEGAAREKAPCPLPRKEMYT
jgi:hypothetical protein